MTSRAEVTTKYAKAYERPTPDQCCYFRALTPPLPSDTLTACLTFARGQA